MYFFTTVVCSFCGITFTCIEVVLSFTVPVDPSPIKFKFPPGLLLLEEFISPEEEMELMNFIDWGDSPASVAEGRH